MIPALLAQNLKNTIALYHGTFGAACERMPNICYQPPTRRECCGFDRGWFLRLALDQPDDLIVGSAGKHR